MPRKKTPKQQSEASAQESIGVLPSGLFTNSATQQRVQAEEFGSLYANNVSIGFSTWDMWITFGEIVGEQNGEPVIEEHTRITMSRELGKVMAILLGSNLRAYESKFGEIRVPALSPEEVKAIAQMTGGKT